MGRTQFGTFTPEWVAPTYAVDENGKVIGGYVPPGESNWGRWGDEDERGAANLITEEHVRSAASLVRRGRVFSLSLPIDNSIPFTANRHIRHYYTLTGADAVVGTPANSSEPLRGFPRAGPGKVYTDDGIDMDLQASTHWDALCHIPEQDTFYNGYWAGSFTALGGPEKLGIGALRSSLVGRGVLLDFARHAGVDSLEPGTVINASDIDSVCATQGVTVNAGDMLLVRTGYLDRWWTLTTDDERQAYKRGNPGVGISIVKWLAERDVVALAIDSIGLGPTPRENPDDSSTLIHIRLMADLGVLIGESWSLGELAADCASDGVYEFLLVAPPLCIPRGAGSPLNPIAIK